MRQILIKAPGLRQQLVLAEMRLVDDDAADDAVSQRLVIVLERREQLLHRAAGPGAAAEQENLLGAIQRFGNRFIEALDLRLALAVGIILHVMQMPAGAG